MRFVFTFLALWTVFLVPAAFADPNYWRWYPNHRPGPAFGENVVLDDRGYWVQRDGNPIWIRKMKVNQSVIDANHSDQRNGELAYAAAYSAYMEGEEAGTNRHEKSFVGRWKKRITTERGIVLLKDEWSNVAVRAPDGKWHVINGQGKYAATSLALPALAEEKVRVAEHYLPATPKGHVSGRAPASIARP